MPLGLHEARVRPDEYRAVDVRRIATPRAEPKLSSQEARLHDAQLVQPAEQGIHEVRREIGLERRVLPGIVPGLHQPS